MKYLLLGPSGLSLEITQEQANKALRYGRRFYQEDFYKDEETGNSQSLFTDGDRWVYEIDIFDETHPLD